MTFNVPENKIKSLLDLLHKAANKQKASARNIASIAGKIISMGLALGGLSRLFTRCMYDFVERRSNWDYPQYLDQRTLGELQFWIKNIEAANGFAIRIDNYCSKILYCDASAYGYGGYLFFLYGFFF